MKKNNGWISAKKMLPRLTSAERKPSSFGRQVLIYPPIQEPGCADQHTAFYGCRLTDEPAFYLHGRVIDVEWWQPLPEPPREERSLRKRRKEKAHEASRAVRSAYARGALSKAA